MPANFEPLKDVKSLNADHSPANFQPARPLKDQSASALDVKSVFAEDAPSENTPIAMKSAPVYASATACERPWLNACWVIERPTASWCRSSTSHSRSTGA